MDIDESHAKREETLLIEHESARTRFSEYWEFQCRIRAAGSQWGLSRAKISETRHANFGCKSAGVFFWVREETQEDWANIHSAMGRR